IPCGSWGAEVAVTEAGHGRSRNSLDLNYLAPSLISQFYLIRSPISALVSCILSEMEAVDSTRSPPRWRFRLPGHGHERSGPSFRSAAAGRGAAAGHLRATGHGVVDRASDRAVREVRRAVYLRDLGRCAFVEFDHYPIPFAAGGRATVDNLQLRCR